jgi:hypothetical protein
VGNHGIGRGKPVCLAAGERLFNGPAEISRNESRGECICKSGAVGCAAMQIQAAFNPPKTGIVSAVLMPQLAPSSSVLNLLEEWQ